MEMMTLGDRAHMNICIVYMEGIVNPALVAELKHRLSTIHTDLVLSSGYITEYIEDAPFSIFETIGYTEKPDVVAGKLLEGRIAVVVDGTPFTLTLPMLFLEHFHSSEDYTLRPYYATFLRLLRLTAFLISMLAPALYVAMVTYHQELIPTALLFTMAAASEGLPFPAVMETGLMLVIFEILKEAGVRLPKPVGQAISIVGALVMGQAAIQAGLVGAPVVIIVALTGVSSFAIPNMANEMSLLRWYLLIMAGILGGYGVTLALLTIFAHLASLKSFSTLFMHPIMPLYAPDLKDTFIRAPLWKMFTRPAALKPVDIIRQRSPRPNFQEDEPEAPQTGDQP
jgi:spore germination protein KA